MANLVKYGSYTVEDAEKDQADIDASSSDILKIKVGRTVLRAIPPLPGRQLQVVVWQHFLHPTPDKTVVVACPRMAVKKPCLVCKKSRDLRASRNSADRDVGFDLSAKRNVFMNVIDRGNPDNGPRTWKYGKQCNEQIVDMRKDEEAGGDFCHPLNGFDLIVVRKGTGKNDTKYTVKRSSKTSPLAPSTDLMNTWIETQPDLSRYGQLTDEGEIEEALRDMGLLEDEGQAADEARDVTPTGKRLAGRTQRRAQDDLEEEEPEDADEDPDDE